MSLNLNVILLKMRQLEQIDVSQFKLYCEVIIKSNESEDKWRRKGREIWVQVVISELGRASPGGASHKELDCQCRRCKRCNFHPWVGKVHWRRAWQPTPVFLPGEFHGQRSLAGYISWGGKELDKTEATQQCICGFTPEQGPLLVLKVGDFVNPLSSFKTVLVVYMVLKYLY